MPKKRKNPRSSRKPASNPLDMLYDHAMDQVDNLLDSVHGVVEDLLFNTIEGAANLPPHQVNQGRSGKRRGAGQGQAQGTGQGRGAGNVPPPPPEPMPTAYDVLEVSFKASQETIEAAYKSLAKKYHPDKVGSTSTETMQFINSAYETLKDPVKRREYDALLRSVRR